MTVLVASAKMVSQCRVHESGSDFGLRTISIYLQSDVSIHTVSFTRAELSRWTEDASVNAVFVY